MIRSISFALVALGLAASLSLAAPPSPPRTIGEATAVLDELAKIPLKCIPPALLAEAQGVAIIPHVIKAGLVVGGRSGHGVVLVRGKDGNWSNPVFVTISGASVGLQAGVESSDVVLVFKARKSLDRILAGKGKLTLGVDAAIAAGPIGRQAEAATDGRMQAEIVSYSRSRGLFAGVALDGACLVNDPGTNAVFAADNRLEVRAEVDGLRRKLAEMSSPPRLVPLVPVVPIRPEPPVIVVPAPVVPMR